MFHNVKAFSHLGSFGIVVPNFEEYSSGPHIYSLHGLHPISLDYIIWMQPCSRIPNVLLSDCAHGLCWPEIQLPGCVRLDQRLRSPFGMPVRITTPQSLMPFCHWWSRIVVIPTPQYPCRDLLIISVIWRRTLIPLKRTLHFRQRVRSLHRCCWTHTRTSNSSALWNRQVSVNFNPVHTWKIKKWWL